MSRAVRILLSLSSGVMLSLPWTGFPGWLLFVSFLPLLALEKFFTDQRSRFGSMAFWSHAFLAFLTWNALTTWWIIHATAIGAFLAIVANSLLMSVTLWLAHLVRRNSVGSMGYLSWIVFWLSFEFFHFHWDIEWPWLTLGNGFAENTRMVQWYEYTGVLGGSLWILGVNLLFFNILSVYAETRRFFTVRLKMILAVSLILVPVILSLFIYSAFEESGKPLKVLIVQPNIDPYSETYDEGAVNDKVAKFIRLTETALTPGVGLIIGPETVFEQQWEEDRIESYPAFQAIQQFSGYPGNPAVLIGGSTFRVYRDPEQKTATARLGRDGSYAYDVFNTAIFSEGPGKVQTYHKSILVSGVEKMPFRKYLRFLDRLIIDLGGTTGTLGVQDSPENFRTGEGDRLAPVICYESVFGGYLTQFVRKGAGAIVIITNDGWWRDTPGYRQHFSFAKLRAIETRRFVARAANTGISGIIDQRGDVRAETEWWKEAALEHEILLSYRMTFYAVNGDYLGRISLFISGLLVLYLLSAVIRKQKNPH